MSAQQCLKVRSSRRSTILELLFPILFLGASSIAASAQAAVVLHFYDANGQLLSGSQALKIMDGNGSGFRCDALIDPVSMKELVALPLSTTTNGLTFTLSSGTPAALEVDWQMATRGYSTLILDNSGSGFTSGATVNFTYQAAKDVKRRLDLSLAARPAYNRSINFQNAYHAATADITIADGSSDDSVKGQYGQLALDQLAVANDLMLSEYGIQFAQSHAAQSAPWLGVTLTGITKYAADFQLASQITQPYGWVRIAFAKGQPPSYYLAAVQAAKARGLKVMGQPIDSSCANKYDAAAYHQRIADYVDYFSTNGNLIDAWEVGNEVNGEWLGSGVGSKVADAASYARRNSNGQVVVTLYWQIGTGPGPANSTFNWAYKYLTPDVLQNVDVVLLSTYPDGGGQMGLAFDEVFQTMHAAFPNQKIGVGELGYAYDGGDPCGTTTGPGEAQAAYGNWYCYPNKAHAARPCVAHQFYTAVLGYDYSVGGVFWWYFSEEFADEPSLSTAVSSVRDSIRTTTTAYKVNSGGGAIAPYAADEFFRGGGLDSTSDMIDLSAVTDPAPMAVYQTERWGPMTYTFPNLTPGASYVVRLHFAEFSWSSSGQRSFNVSIQGVPAMTQFDIIHDAGTSDKAIMEEFIAIADPQGNITVQYNYGTNNNDNNPKSSGLEILSVN